MTICDLIDKLGDARDKTATVRMLFRLHGDELEAASDGAELVCRDIMDELDEVAQVLRLMTLPAGVADTSA